MKSYTIVEVQPDGRVYAVIERADGSTFGQMVAVGIPGATDAEIDQAICLAVATAERIGGSDTPKGALSEGRRMAPRTRTYMPQN